jgi:hypothetical protein
MVEVRVRVNVIIFVGTGAVDVVVAAVKVVLRVVRMVVLRVQDTATGYCWPTVGSWLMLAWLLELSRGLLELDAWLTVVAELLLCTVILLEELTALVEVGFAELSRVGVAVTALQTWETAGAASAPKGLPLRVGLWGKMVRDKKVCNRLPSTYELNQKLQKGRGWATSFRRASRYATLLTPVGEAIALVCVPPIRAGVALMHLQTLLISAGVTPGIGLVDLYEAPIHHWQKVRGMPKSFLMAAITGSEATHATSLIPVATGFWELVTLVFWEEELAFLELVEDTFLEVVDDIFLELVLAARATRPASEASGMIGRTPLISPRDCRASRLSTTALRFWA